MPQQLTTRGPVQVREYIPDRASQASYQERAELVNRVKVHERGPDITVDVFRQNLRIGSLSLPRECEDLLLARLFGEVPERRADRAAFQVVLQGFEDAVLSGDAERVIQAWRRAFEVFDTMARDIATLSGLPQQGSTAA